MNNIELIIKISEDSWKATCNGYMLPSDVENVVQGIKNGTPLPKGHGRLIDADKTALLSELFCYTKYTGIDEAPYEDATNALDFAPTIIEADKEE